MDIQNIKPTTISLAEKPIINLLSRHIVIHYHYSRKKVECGDVKLLYIFSSNQIADIFTKPHWETSVLEIQDWTQHHGTFRGLQEIPIFLTSVFLVPRHCDLKKFESGLSKAHQHTVQVTNDGTDQGDPTFELSGQAKNHSATQEPKKCKPSSKRGRVLEFTFLGLPEQSYMNREGCVATHTLRFQHYPKNAKVHFQILIEGFCVSQLKLWIPYEISTIRSNSSTSRISKRWSGTSDVGSELPRRKQQVGGCMPSEAAKTPPS